MRDTRKKKFVPHDKKSTQKEKVVETKENLASLLKDYESKLKLSGYKVQRLKDLLSRKFSFKLNERKLLKLQKKLAEAEEEYSFSQVAIDQIGFRLTQIS
jgi:hypothetical protein